MTNNGRIRPNGRGIYWCWTLNNPTEQHIETLTLLASATVLRGRDIKYLVCQEESAGTGTVHLQGYVEFLSRKTLRSAKNKLGLGDTVHLEPRRGRASQAIDYCKKQESRREGGFTCEYGEPTITDKEKLDELARKVRNGVDPRDLKEDYPTLTLLHGKKLEEEFLNSLGSRDWTMEIEIYYGNSGCGKSVCARKKYPDAYHVMWPKGGRWWFDNYRGESTVILDEFRHQVKFDEFLSIMDSKPWRVEWKGGSGQFLAKRLVFTTNLHPKHWYPGVKPDVKEPLLRRLKEFAKLYEFTGHPGEERLTPEQYANFSIQELEQWFPRVEIPWDNFAFEVPEEDLDGNGNMGGILMGNNRTRSSDDW